MQLACPNCQNQIELDQLSGDRVLCLSCGSSFRLERESTVDWDQAAGPRRLGKFELLQQVGQGAFGIVYKARDVELGRTVAVKVPRPSTLGASSGDSERFLREARSIAHLRHPTIVPIYDVRQEEDVPFLVCEFVEGVTLADLLTGERLPPNQAAELVATVAEALHYAHEQGVIHRDVKPSNIMLERAGVRNQESGVRGQESGGRKASAGSFLTPDSCLLTPRLMDFGLAKRQADEITMTLEGQVLGTPAYMSPEQARGEGHHVDGRSDIYSLGVILYQLLAGQLPFKGNQQMLLQHVLFDEPRPPRKLDAKIPRDLETICMKAMAKEPKVRYQTARDLADDLRRFVRGEPIRARPAGLVERSVKWYRRRRHDVRLVLGGAVVMGAVVIALGVAALSGWLPFLDRKDPPTVQGSQDKIAYYANVVKRWGVPEGIGPITEEQARRRPATYKVYRRDGKVERVDAVNGLGHFTTRLQMPAPLEAVRPGFRRRRPCRWDYKYNTQGELTEEVARDMAGLVLSVFHYTTRSTAHFTDEEGFPLAQAGSGAAYVSFVWSDDGLEKEVRYLDRRSRPSPDPDGIFARRHEHNSHGQVTAITYLGFRNQPALHRDGYARVARLFDQSGDLVEESFFGIDGRPTLHRDGFHKQTITVDSDGRDVAWAYFGTDGQAVLQQNGSHRTSAAYDRHGNLSETAYFGLRGEPVAIKFNEYAKVRMAYDSRGNLIEYAYFGLDGKPTVDRFSGAAKRRYVFSEHDDLLELSYVGIDDQPVLEIDVGVAKIRRKYDERGLTIEMAYFGVDNEPILGKFGGSAKHHYGYDRRGNPTEVASYDVTGKLAPIKRGGFAKARYAYDDNGNQIEDAYFDADEQPVLNMDGIARTTRKYDDSGNEIEEAFFDPVGKPIVGRLGYARRLLAYDEHGQITGSTYFDAAGKAVPTRVVIREGSWAWLIRYYNLDWRPGDVVLAFNGTEVTCNKRLASAIRYAPPRTTPNELRILRDGKEQTITLPAFLPEHFWWQLETRAARPRDK